MFTCFIHYTVEPNKLKEFKEYAESWIPLIEKYGGTHHGYFMPGDETDAFPDPTFSFPGLGEIGPPNRALALFSFPNVEAYETYREKVAQDPECLKATDRFNASKCFSGYQRTFLKPILQ